MPITFNKCFPLQGNSYVKPPEILKSSMKRLLKNHNNENKCFRWCHVRNYSQTFRNQSTICYKSNKNMVFPLLVRVAHLKMLFDQEEEVVNLIDNKLLIITTLYI